jgi:hypothetical protein
MTKNEWLNELIFVDMYGRKPNLSDVPMTMMVRKEAFKKQGINSKEIKQQWNDLAENYLVKSH